MRYDKINSSMSKRINEKDAIASKVHFSRAFGKKRTTLLVKNKKGYR